MGHILALYKNTYKLMKILNSYYMEIEEELTRNILKDCYGVISLVEGKGHILLCIRMYEIVCFCLVEVERETLGLGSSHLVRLVKQVVWDSSKKYLRVVLIMGLVK